MINELEVNEKTLKDYEEIWKPLMQTDGKWDDNKIKNELLDLIFVYNQISEVYCHITGNRLSKPMYYASTIKTTYDDMYQEAYDEGWDDCMNDKEYVLTEDGKAKLDACQKEVT